MKIKKKEEMLKGMKEDKEYSKKIIKEITEEITQMSRHPTFQRFAYIKMDDIQKYFQNKDSKFSKEDVIKMITNFGKNVYDKKIQSGQLA